MLYARLVNGNWVLGVDAENIQRLTHGEDILINLQQFGDHDMPLIMLVYADTMEGLKGRLEQASGGPLPPETKRNEH